MTRDLIDLRTARAVAAFLDLAQSDQVPGAPLPLMWHLFYFLDHPAQADIGPDGHSTVGTATPEGMRRMFAGGRVEMHRGLRVGDDAAVSTKVIDDRVREGRSGRMRFVTHRSEVTVSGDLAIVDERDIVYLPATPSSPTSEDASSRSRPPDAEQPPQDAVRRTVAVDPTLLFRFSALTYNAHRIHYDRDYARKVEGYPGLVIHGPLQALLMAHAAAQFVGRQAGLRYSYRLVAPLFEADGLHVAAWPEIAGVTARIVSDTGRTTARGRLEPI